MKSLVALLLLTYVAVVQGVVPRAVGGHYYNKVGYGGRTILNMRQIPKYNQNTNLNYVGALNGVGVVARSNTAVNINNPAGLGVSGVDNVGNLGLIPYSNYLGINGVVGNVNPGYISLNNLDDDDDNNLYRYNLGVYRGSYYNNLRRNIYIRRSIYTPNLVSGDGVLGRGIYNNVYNNNLGVIGGVAVVGVGGNNNGVYTNNLGVPGGVAVVGVGGNNNVYTNNLGVPGAVVGVGNNNVYTNNLGVLGGFPRGGINNNIYTNNLGVLGGFPRGGINNNIYTNNLGVLGGFPRGGNAYNLGSYTIPNNGRYGNVGRSGGILQITKRII